MSVNRSGRREWLIPTGLILLALVPVVAGAIRVADLSTGPVVTPDNARFVHDPLPVVVHAVAASLYCLLGAFQFAPGFRRRHLRWHRAAGRVLVPAGLLTGLSGIWMSLFYPLLPIDGELLIGLRISFGSAMVVCIVLGFVAILRRDITRHRAWMIRGYAIGQGAGTQFLTHLPWMLVSGPPDELPRALLHAAGWLINIAVAEWIIRAGSARRPASTAGG
ncbi:hypothetical protein C1I95_14955 [Micromonospora craterilacus]|uniref:DUF2306 domain-containing protein n=1 Tax=Micromonospora craterilacus TaxID=1655439 RepID=A0A2W2FRP3_9ACTN|nr:DUF2306 domain-containing protein [Micromonospora craterilacus]PZG17674.1 hypothetical protein C1I95_14955 [Micromonospora craterilacus]